jgi:hypothetical protein
MIRGNPPYEIGDRGGYAGSKWTSGPGALTNAPTYSPGSPVLSACSIQAE